MKKLLILVSVLVGTALIPVYAQTMGIGGVVGRPTGASLNLFTAKDQSIHTVGGWHLNDDDVTFSLSSHYTWRRQDFGDKGAGWFYGLGAKLDFLDQDDKVENPESDDFMFGPSATLGILYDFSPIEVFLKTNGTVMVVEDTEFDADVMIGAHYNF